MVRYDLQIQCLNFGREFIVEIILKTELLISVCERDQLSDLGLSLLKPAVLISLKILGNCCELSKPQLKVIFSQ